jgi:type I restriction enzyme M protein
MSVQDVSKKVWNIAGVLYDDGVSNQDYLEQVTYLLFLKMIDEFNNPPYNKDIPIPETARWNQLATKTGSELEEYYQQVLTTLSKTPGLLQQIYIRAQNKINTPTNLARVIKMIDSENWSSMSQDVKGDIYEGLLEKVAEDTKSGAGQYFTPRALINSIVKCIKPEVGKTIADPACGSGGFLLAAQDYIMHSYGTLYRNQYEDLKFNTFFGTELVPATYRQCLMNLFLHNIGDITIDDEDYTPPIFLGDSLMTSPKQHYDYVLANPPFGKKSSNTITNDEGNETREDIDYNRQDFWVSTSNKQLNFVQHIYTMLKVGGEAAVVVPDNVLFEGGAGETVRKKLLETCELHTILRLPTGIFYKPGVQANVIFFRKKSASSNPWTKEIWVYDFRTGNHFTLKQNPLTESDLKEFIDCYIGPDRNDCTQTYNENKNPEGRFRCYTYEEIIERDKTSLDVRWLKTENDDEDITLAELVEGIKDEAVNITKATAELEKLLKGIINE